MSKTNTIVLREGTSGEKLKEITDCLEQGIKDLFAGDQYREYLKVMGTIPKFV